MNTIVIDVDRMEMEQLTPNEVFLLHSLDKNLDSAHIFHFCNVNHLENLGVIDCNGVITEVGKEIISTIVNPPSIPAITSSAMSLAMRIIDIFPRGIKSGGLPVRDNAVNVEKKIRKFKNDYPQYTDDQIIDAVTKYVNDKKKEGYTYMKTASYLIYKDNVSTLASLIDSITDNGAETTPTWGTTV